MIWLMLYTVTLTTISPKNSNRISSQLHHTPLICQFLLIGWQLLIPMMCTVRLYVSINVMYLYNVM